MMFHDDDAVPDLDSKSESQIRREAKELRKRLEETSPQKRLFTAEEVSALVLFLCGDAARGINGQAINLDGGTVV